MEAISKNSKRLVTESSKLINLFKTYQSLGGITILTGAGISTDSGIPDYRGPKGAYIVNPDFKPITYQHFISSHKRRQRYWTRSYFGYPKFFNAQPNASHKAITVLQNMGYINNILTQNVDDLHYKANSKNIIELHGTLKTVECLSCQHKIERKQFQDILSELNPKWHEELINFLNSKIEPPTTPDGDVLLSDNTPFNLFKIPECFKCKIGIYKPSVVYFGENMKINTKLDAKLAIDNSNALLVIGSSLATPSAYRLVKSIKDNNKPVYILNLGTTRADSLVDYKMNLGSTQVLNEIINNKIILS